MIRSCQNLFGASAMRLALPNCLDVRPWLAGGLLLVVCLNAFAEEPVIFESQPSWAEGVISGDIGGDPAAPQTILFTADHTFPKGLRVFQSEAKQRYQSLLFKAGNGGGTKENRTLTLQGPLSVDFGRNGEVNALFDQQITFDFAGAPAVLETVTSDSHIELHGPIRNARGFTKGGKGSRVYLSGGDLGGVVGPLQIDGGWLVIRDQAVLPGIIGIALAGRSREPAYLAMEGEGVSDRLPDAAPISASGGSVIALSGGSEKTVSESLGRVTVRDNALQLDVRGKEIATPVTLMLSDLERDPASLLIVGREKLGEAGFVKVQRDTAILSAMKGGGGGPGSKTVSVLPWARGFGGGHLDNAYGFLTYARETGFRELKPEEYVEGLRAATRPTENVRVTTTEPALTQSKTINALFCSLPSSLRHRVVDLGDKVLTISSGALSAENQTAILSGALTTGSDQPLSFVGNFDLNTRLVGKGGAVFYAGGMTRLTDPRNSLAGDWTFVGGRVLVTDDEIIPDGVTLRLHRGAELWLEGSESVTAIAGKGEIKPAVGGRSALMLGFCVAQANQVVLGVGGAIYPGDQSKAPAVGTLHLWALDSDSRIGFLKIEDGTLAIDLAPDGSDAVVLQSENKAATISGGTLRVNRVGGFTPKVGASWEIIAGTAPAAGQGFASVVDAAGKGYAYSVAPVGNSWVLTVTDVP